MASYNLGRIKGDKGDRGMTGAKGDKGEKGDRGDTGEKGADGKTPVFSVAETVTLPSRQQAYVETDTTDIANPKLYFYIPRGENGQDASGNMETAIYDTQGQQQDIFKYADALYQQCLKKSGDSMVGELTAHQCSPQTSCVRNIGIKTQLPETAAEGDICILRTEENTKTLGDCDVGSTVIIKETDNDTEYVIAAKDYSIENSLVLVRKYLFDKTIKISSITRSSYALTDADLFLETIYRSVYSQAVQKSMLMYEIERHMWRHCFALSETELRQMPYFAENGLQAQIKNQNTNSAYITRTFTENPIRCEIVNSTGEFDYLAMNSLCALRPAFVLPYHIRVENISYNNQAAVQIKNESPGVFVYENGQWKECGTWQQ